MSSTSSTLHLNVEIVVRLWKSTIDYISLIMEEYNRLHLIDYDYKILTAVSRKHLQKKQIYKGYKRVYVGFLCEVFLDVPRADHMTSQAITPKSVCQVVYTIYLPTLLTTFRISNCLDIK